MTTRTTARRTRKTAAATIDRTAWQLGEIHGRQSALCSLTGEGEQPVAPRFTRESDQRDYDWASACAANRAEREFFEARELAR
jgi:hypothetical protein